MNRAIPALLLILLPIIAHAAPELAEQEAARAYEKAAACYHTLMLNEPRQKLRGNWEACMKQFAAIVRDYNETARAPDAFFTLGKMYRLLGQQSHNKEDAREAYTRFSELTTRYKKSRYYDDALYEMACIRLYTFGDESKAKRLLTQIIRWNPDGDRVNDAKNLMTRIKAGKARGGEPEPLKPQGALLHPRSKPLEASPATPSPSAKTAIQIPAEKKSPQP